MLHRKSLVSLFFPLSLAAVLAFGPACKAGIEAPLNKVRETAKDLVDDASDWIEGDAMAMRREKCSEEGGRWEKKLVIAACTDGETTIESESGITKQACGESLGLTADDQCVHEDSAGRIFFNDGPSIPLAMQKLTSLLHQKIDQTRYNDLFWEAGRQHDLCYHHNPITDGLSQADCDDRFFNDLSAVCAYGPYKELSWFEIDICRHMAAAMYAAVRSEGEASYELVNLFADIPAYIPVWQQLGMSENPHDQELHDEVDAQLNKFNFTDE